jgi:hypothetical protein
MRTVLLVLALVAVLFCVVGCTEEQEAQVEGAAGAVGTTASRVGPFLPAPFNWIAHLVGVAAAGTGAWMARRRGQRAETLEIRVLAESKVKDDLARAGRNLEEGFDELLADPKHGEDVKKGLLALKEWKLKNPWARRSIGLLDGIRKGIITVDQLTNDAIAGITADRALSRKAVAPTVATPL